MLILRFAKAKLEEQGHEPVAKRFWMTDLRMVPITLTAVLTILVSLAAVASDDAGTRDLLIKKLGLVQSSLPQNDPSSVAVTLRLADLLSERARVNSMDELNQGCTECKSGTADRKKALQFYREAVARAPLATKPKVLIQMGHLSQMNGLESEAIKNYTEALGLNPSAEVVAEANLAIAEIHFKARNFALAQTFYDKVIGSPAAASKGLAAYRKAWCNFNLGKLTEAQAALVTILQTPSLLTRSASTTTQVDPQFHEEVSRDYVTFLSKGELTQAKAESLFTLSPAATKVQNVQSLAYEAERIGRKTEALSIWKYIFGHLDNVEDRVAAHTSQAQLNYDLGDKAKSLEHYTLAIDGVANANNCKSAQCDEVRRRLRQFIVNWHQSEKKNPSVELLSAYTKFTALYPADSDMQIFAGQLSLERKDFAAAEKFYDQAIVSLSTSRGDPKKLDSALLAMLEVGELSKNEATINKAYQQYLNFSPTQTKRFEVNYQLARNEYEAGRYEVAATALKELALNLQGDLKVRKQAADLALDSLALLKDNVRLQAWSSEFSTIFNDADYLNIAQKAVLTTAAELAKTDERAAYIELTKFTPAKASSEDRVKFLKNKIILSQKLSLFNDALSAADELLKQPGITEEDRTIGWTTKAEIAELRLDFAGAVIALDNLKAGAAPEAKALKLALFAELAGQSSAERYQTYLRLSKNTESNAMVAAQLIRSSKSPLKDLEKFKGHLAGSPELAAQVSAEVLAKNYNSVLANTILKDPKIRNTPAGQLVSRVEFLRGFDVAKSKLTAATLDTSSDRKLTSSIKTRVALLDQVEAKTKQAIESGDWTSQFVSIDTLAKESERFYQELMSAPMPQGLSQEDEIQYLSLLSAQATPFQSKASEAKLKVEQFESSDWVTAVRQSWKSIELRPLVSRELEALKQVTNSAKKTELAELTTPTQEATASGMPSVTEITSARKQVFEQPNSRSALEHLLGVEQKAQNKAMIQYLQTRISQLSPQKGSL